MHPEESLTYFELQVREGCCMLLLLLVAQMGLPCGTICICACPCSPRPTAGRTLPVRLQDRARQGLDLTTALEGQVIGVRTMTAQFCRAVGAAAPKRVDELLTEWTGCASVRAVKPEPCRISACLPCFLHSPCCANVQNSACVPALPCNDNHRRSWERMCRQPPAWAPSRSFQPGRRLATSR